MKINGIAAPLDYVSPTQINAQVPYEIAPGTAQLTIESNGTTAGPAGLTIQSATPGIFGDAGGRAAAINQDGTVNLPGNPAPAGSFISVYLTGQGQVDRLVASGAAAPIGPISNTLAQTTATIGGVPAPVFRARARLGRPGPGKPAGSEPAGRRSAGHRDHRRGSLQFGSCHGHKIRTKGSICGNITHRDSSVAQFWVI